MRSCINKEECICKRRGGLPSECIGSLTIQEKGKSLTLTLRNNEEAIAVILDKCLISDNKTKSDAIFLYRSRNKKIIFLIELKGFGEIEKAFNQLRYTRDEREEYQEIKMCFERLDNKILNERFIIVTNGKLKTHEKERLERENKIRVRGILYSDSSSKIPDLRECI